jgi:hypothetical protein
MSYMKEQWQREQERLDQDMRELNRYNNHSNMERQTVEFVDKAEYDAWCAYNSIIGDIK